MRYSANYSGLGELMRSQEMQQVVRDVALKGAEYARSISPVDTGEYKSSFEVTVTGEGGPDGDRAEARILNTSGHAAAVEWQDGYHVLQRTAAALGHL